ncbi:larval cuticle protein 1-like [Cylas formicarius]|uniref:larval cuticle protein 1-like n=1 Tax=Cylas formicarius TaxID=197179 RepID=UPI00295887AA|nr:larval cuticle protein 1-like [Cylas formicarius]
MISKIAVLSCLLAVVLSAALPQQVAQEPVPIVSQEINVEPDGKFQWSYESGDGTKQEQTGEPKQIENEIGEAIQGSVSWTDPEGNQHSLKYVADENGYQPESEDIPKPPEIPAAIARALEYNAAHPEEEEKN